METNILALIATLGTTVVGAFVGAYMSSRFGYRQGALAESDRRRCETADTVIPQLIELRRLLRNAETSRTTTEWAKVTEASYEALDDARHLLPLGLKHLKQSIRTSVGEAMGPVAMADIDPEMLEYGLSPYDHRWTSYAIDYLDGALDHIRAWRDARSSQVSALSMRDYDDWLAHTNRYLCDSYPSGRESVTLTWNRCRADRARTSAPSAEVAVVEPWNDSAVECY